MIFTIFLFIRLINSFGIDQQSKTRSQRGYFVLHYRYTIAIRGYAKDWTVTSPQIQLRSGLFVCVEVLH